MALYMIQFSYSSGAVADLVKNPSDRAAVVRAWAESMGGRVESFYFAFGKYDGIAITEVPDNVTMAAISMAVAASGAFKSFHTTVLLTPEESTEAMRKAGTLNYRPPGG
jgi:uncharacterized protein with GYD domain